jgi:hypothetical protein
MGPTVVKPVWTSRRREKSYALDGVWNVHPPVRSLVNMAQ